MDCGSYFSGSRMTGDMMRVMYASSLLLCISLSTVVLIKDDSIVEDYFTKLKLNFFLCLHPSFCCCLAHGLLSPWPSIKIEIPLLFTLLRSLWYISWLSSIVIIGNGIHSLWALGNGSCLALNGDFPVPQLTVENAVAEVDQQAHGDPHYKSYPSHHVQLCHQVNIDHNWEPRQPRDEGHSERQFLAGSWLPRNHIQDADQECCKDYHKGNRVPLRVVHQGDNQWQDQGHNNVQGDTPGDQCRGQFCWELGDWWWFGNLTHQSCKSIHI